MSKTTLNSKGYRNGSKGLFLTHNSPDRTTCLRSLTSLLRTSKRPVAGVDPGLGVRLYPHEGRRWRHDLGSAVTLVDGSDGGRREPNGPLESMQTSSGVLDG
jgi:hypothetical protein